jgi:hypothetical protein
MGLLPVLSASGLLFSNCIQTSVSLQFCNVASVVVIMGNDLAKFGYKQNMKVKSVKNPSMLLATKWNLMQPSFFFNLIIRKHLNIYFHIFKKFTN